MNPRRIVVKVGTRLVAHANGKLNLNFIEKLVRELSDLRNRGLEVILVSSGAIGAGIGRLNMPRRPESIPEKQAAAAVGQGLLIQIYEKFFAEYGLIVAQILLTRSDLISRRRYLNASNTILTLLRWGVVPIINENDTVAVHEIKFGDNDQLSALVAGLCDADLVIVLTNIDGLYTANPRKDKTAQLIPAVKEITAEVKSWGEASDDDLSTGGMVTKLQAAEIATSSGIGLYIANGNIPAVLHRILNGEQVGTYFYPQKKFLNRRKRWIAYGRVVQGKVVIDDGARKALCHDRKSLLPIGVIDVQGSFDSGALVAVVDQSGTEIGRGLTNFSAAELLRIKSRPSSEIERLIGRTAAAEVIHRDNLVIHQQ
ncbi:MAG: glutamate 5-kinase [Firmicutes bacterium]|nr:glutamate 5-kinase [Bacillota bacterium]